MLNAVHLPMSANDSRWRAVSEVRHAFQSIANAISGGGRGPCTVSCGTLTWEANVNEID